MDYVVAADARPWTVLQPVTPIPSVLRGLFQGVPVPAGRHLVSLEYRPLAVLWGLGLSSLCAIAMLGLRPAQRGKRLAG